MTSIKRDRDRWAVRWRDADGRHRVRKVASYGDALAVVLDRAETERRTDRTEAARQEAT